MPGEAMNNKHLTPMWIVYVDGQRLDIAHEGALQRIVVDDRLNDVGLATLSAGESIFWKLSKTKTLINR